jgi:ParB-like chromosome segregation protein Spo0J
MATSKRSAKVKVQPTTEMATTEMAIADIVISPAVYPRLDYSFERVSDLVDALEAGADLPPITVQRGTGVLLAGRHRVEAYKRLGRTRIAAVAMDVADEDLLAFACQQDNATGLPYTQEDRQDVARRLFAAGTDLATVADVVHRSRQTVERWLQPEIEQATECTDRARAVRAVVVQALNAGGLSRRAIAPLLGISKSQVSSDAQMSIAGHLAAGPAHLGCGVVDEASSLLKVLAENAQNERFTARVENACDWLRNAARAATTPTPATPDQGPDDEDLDDDQDDLDPSEHADPAPVALVEHADPQTSLWFIIEPVVTKLRASVGWFEVHVCSDNGPAASAILQTAAEMRTLLDDLVRRVEAA